MTGVPRVLLLPLLAIVLSLSGCGSDNRPSADAAGPGRHAHEHRKATRHQTPAPDRAPTASANPSTLQATSGTHTSRTRTGKSAPLLPLPRTALATHLLAVHLLAGDRMPALTNDFAWRVLDDGPEDTQSVGACQKASLETIGAVTAVRRTYAEDSGGSAEGAGGSAVATQVVARFADDKSAWRAHEVLQSWREDCEERLDYPRKDVGPLRTVVVRVGTGNNYRTVYGPKATKRDRTAGFGIVRTGSFLSIVEITTGPEDYPSDWDPARAAVRRISRTFS